MFDLFRIFFWKFDFFLRSIIFVRILVFRRGAYIGMFLACP